MTVPHVPILSPDQLPISLGTPLDGRSKTVVSDLINPYGFVVFRGYGVSSDQEFHDFIECFGLPNFTYAESFSNAVRRNRTPRVFTANEAPPEIEIFLHHEMAQTLVFPGQLFFFCEQAPTKGGATPIGRSDLALVALEKARPDFVAKLRNLGVRYRNAMPDSADLASGQGRSWRDTLNVVDRNRRSSVLQSWGTTSDGWMTAACRFKHHHC